MWSKLTRNRVLQGRVGFFWTPKGGDEARKFSCQGEAGMRQDKTIWGGGKNPIFRPRLAPFQSPFLTHQKEIKKKKKKNISLDTPHPLYCSWNLKRCFLSFTLAFLLCIELMKRLKNVSGGRSSHERNWFRLL